MDVISEDSYLYQFPKMQYSVNLTAGKTIDAIIANPAVEDFYPVYDRSLSLTNAAQPNGGMLAFLNIGNLNIPPTISSITATPATIIDGMTSQLSVMAIDPEGSSLTYNWVVPAGDGSLDSAAISNPLYTAPGDIVGTEVITLDVTVGDGTDSINSSIDITVQGAFLSETFDASTGTFTYVDNAFRSTTEGAYALGGYAAAAFTGGGLLIEVGGIDSVNIFTGMSGAWTTTFNLVASSNVNISFRYRLTQSANYEPDEYSETLVAVDGMLYGLGGNDYIARIVGNGEGGLEVTTDWQQATINIGTLAAGSHTIAIGVHNNKKTSAIENSNILIDDVLIIP